MNRKSIAVIILAVFFMLTVTGCSLLNNRPNIQLAPSTDNVLQPIRNEPTEETSNNLIENSNTGASSSKGIQWQIELKGDPGVQINRYTHLPAEELIFMVTFSEEMDKSSVEEALQANLNTDADTQEVNPPKLKFSWLNPIQLEIIFPGNKVESSLNSITYKISPLGAKNMKGTQSLSNQDAVTFSIYPSSTIFPIDVTGEILSPTIEIPFSLQPEGINPTGETLLLGRWTELSTDGNSIAYLYDIKEKKIKQVFSEGKELPFWGNDQNLYYLTDNALIQLNEGGEKWIEFAQYPYIHGWSISPDLKNELFLLSNKNDPNQTEISILVKDLETQEEVIYTEQFPMNPNDDYDGGIIRFPLEWISGTSQVYISSFGKNGIDYIFDVEQGKLSEAPSYLQSITPNTPKWSADGQYIASIDQGILDSAGREIQAWGNYSPNSSLYWHPILPILAYESYTENGKQVIQMNVETGEKVATPGDYRILGWNPNGDTLLVIQEK